MVRSATKLERSVYAESVIFHRGVHIQIGAKRMRTIFCAQMS